LPIIALRGFCGIRHAEALRLTWEDVWSKEGIIEIAIEKSKTKQRRTVPRCKALETWLKPYRRFNGIIWKQSDSVFGHAQNALHKLISVSGDNVLRDAYASYRLAITQSADQVSLEMGNSSDMVFTHYAEVVTPNAAQEWFSLLPKIESAAVVNIQA
jgi:integrase